MDCQLCSRGIFVDPPVVNENQPSAVVHLAWQGVHVNIVSPLAQG